MLGGQILLPMAGGGYRTQIFSTAGCQVENGNRASGPNSTEGMVHCYPTGGWSLEGVKWADFIDDITLHYAADEK